MAPDDTGSDLRLMIAEIAAARTCDRLRDSFRPLVVAGAEPRVAGTLWIERCRDTVTGDKVALELGGRGWLWVSQEQVTAGTGFAVTQNVRFRTTVAVTGTLDAAYAPEKHIATVWFTPEGTPDVSFEAIGDIAVDQESLWSAVLGTLAAAVTSSPESRAAVAIAARGRETFQEAFVIGIAATVDLCSGEVVTDLAHPAEGEMIDLEPALPPIQAALHSRGLLIFGPFDTAGGLKMVVDVSGGGQVGAQLMCREQATALASAYLEDRPPPPVETVASGLVAGRAELSAAETVCPAYLAVRSGSATAPVNVSIAVIGKQPKREPLATCAAKPQ